MQSFQAADPVSEEAGEPIMMALAAEADALAGDAALQAPPGPLSMAIATDMPPAAAAIPEPAPRDGAGNPLLMEGTVLAFASDDIAALGGTPPPVAAEALSGRPLRAGAIQAPGRASDQAPVHTSPSIGHSGEPPSQSRPATLFETLFQRRRQAPAQPPARIASLGGLPTAVPAMQVPAGKGPQAPAPGSQLPGVKGQRELFGLTEEDHEEAEGDYEVAAVGGLGRLSPNGLRLQTDSVDAGCLEPELVNILKQVERRFGRPPIVTSGYRSAAINRKAGGARRSLHMQCKAADIQVEGVSKFDLAKFLRTVPGRGGVGTYCRTHSVHIDTGKQREWHYPCRRIKKRAS